MDMRSLFRFNKNIKEISLDFSIVRSIALGLEDPSFIFHFMLRQVISKWVNIQIDGEP